MNRSIVRNLAIAALLAYPASALGADPAPDVKGKWVGKTHTIIAGRGMHWPKARGTFEKPALLEKDLVIEITGQEGRRFWGTTIISGGGEKTDEPFIGELTGKDNRRFASPTPTVSGTENSTATTRSRFATCIRAARVSQPSSAALRSSERADVVLRFDPGFSEAVFYCSSTRRPLA